MSPRIAIGVHVHTEPAHLHATLQSIAANTTYRVVISATREGEPLEFSWTFTTGAADGRPRQ